MPFSLYTPEMTLISLQDSARQELSLIYLEAEATALVRQLTAHFTGYASYQLIAYGDRPVSVELFEKLSAGLRRLAAGEPLQYITGSTDFYGMHLQVGPGVLIPRPETEELVDWIVKDYGQQRRIGLEGHLSGPDAPAQFPRILDLGTGSGAIALGLKKGIPEAEVTGIDISEQALEIARCNALLNKLEVSFSRHDLLAGPDSGPCLLNTEAGTLDLIVSNPPYVLEAEKDLMRNNVLEFEPHLALFVPDIDPMRFYRPIADFAAKALTPRGLLYFEINEAFEAETRETLAVAGFSDIVTRNDLQGKARMMRAGR